MMDLSGIFLDCIPRESRHWAGSRNKIFKFNECHLDKQDASIKTNKIQYASLSNSLSTCTLANSLDPDQAQRSGSKLFDILMVFQKEFFQKVNYEKNQQTKKKHKKLPSMQ